MIRLTQHFKTILIVLVIYTPAAAADDEKAAQTLNEKVLEFAKGKVGEVVGNGQCTSLVSAAYRSVGAKRFPPFGLDADFVWGERLESVKDARPGDVLQFRDAVFKGRKVFRNGRVKFWEYKYPHHTAVVSDVKKTKTGVILTVVHQNVIAPGVGEDDIKPVRMDTLDTADLQPGGQVIAYRPVAAD